MELTETDSNLSSLAAQSRQSDHDILLHKSQQSQSDSATPEPTAGWTYLAIIALATTFTASQLPSFFYGPCLVFIANDLHLGSERSWISVSSSLTFACVAPCAGNLQDLFGRKGSLAGAMFLSCVSLILTATGQSFAQLIAGSVLGGIANAVQELTAIAAISELVPAKKRGLFLGLNTVIVLFFTPTNLYAQLLSTHATWRWLFWIALMWNVIAVVALSLTYFRMHISSDHRPAGKFKLGDIDYVGIVLMCSGLTMFLVAIQTGGLRRPWNSAYVLSLLIISVVLLGFLVFWESRDRGRPLIPFRLFRGQRVVGLCLIIGIFGGIDYTSTLNMGPELLQAVYEFGPIGYGLIALGPSMGLAIGATGVNILLTVIPGGRARELLTVATVVMTAFSGAQSIMNPFNSTTYAILGAFASLGIGATLVPITTLVTLACPEDLIGTAVALIASCRTVGGTIGYAILYNIFLSKSGDAIPSEMAPRLLQAGLPRNEIATFIRSYVDAASGGGDFGGNNGTHYDPAILAAARLGFQYGTSQGARMVYLVTIAFGGAAILCSLALPDMKKYMTDRVVARSAPSTTTSTED